MTSIGTYKRDQDEKDNGIHDAVEMKIQADTEKEKEECLKDLMTIHEILEECGVFKKNP